MDFQKEKEAFENVFTEAKGWDLTFIMGCYQNIETLRAFAGWLAAKAQAVLEGFVLVPKQPTPKMIDATWNFDEEIQDMSHNSRNEFIYNAMIAAAQEPTA